MILILVSNHTKEYDFDLQSFLVVILDFELTLKNSNHFNIIIRAQIISSKL